MKHYLFLYGTLQEDEVQLELFGRRLMGAKDILKGYKASSIEISDDSFETKSGQEYFIAEPSGNEQIEGTAFEVSEEELLVADSYEPEEYGRVKVALESGKQAWVYVAV